jgi:chaperone required for assembly of F1-ATPase
VSNGPAKRFWTEVHVVPDAGGHKVHLDTRALRTPAKQPLVLPTQGLAEAIAAEWRAQTGKIRPDTMPFTRTANSAIDKVQAQHDEVANLIADYGDSDLLCYRAPGPETLVRRQAEGWNPLLDWARKVLGAELTVQTGVSHVPQDAEVLEKLSTDLRRMNHFELAAFHDLVSLSGSLVLGLACIRGVQPPESLWKFSRIVEEWQQEQWGVDDEAAELAERKRQAFLDAARFYNLSQ